MTQTDKKRVIIIDALNMFLRAYIVDPSLSTNGDPIGGIKGSFKILQKLVRMTKPDSVVIVWDGPNGSRKRRSMDKNYKAGRKPLRLNRSVNNLTDNQITENKIWQQSRTIDYINQMPIVQIMIPEVEADDVIAYVTNMSYYTDWQKVIISNDKDFLQLINKNVIVYRPMEKKYYTEEVFKEKYKMSPQNFILHKTLLGDNSDKIKGVKGLGEKGLLKKFPELSERNLTFDDIFEICEKKFKEHVVYARIVQGVDELEKNYKVMDLSNPMLSKDDKNYLDKVVESKELHYHPDEFIAMYNEDQLGGLIRNVEFWIKDVFANLVIKK